MALVVNLVTLGFAGLGLAIAALAARMSARAWSVYDGAAARRLRELPAGQVLVPAAIEQEVRVLEGLGFAPLAVLGLDLPGMAGPLVERLLLGEDRTVQAEVVAPHDEPFVAFVTRMADGFVVETHYPERVRLVRPTVDLGGTTASERAAIALHAERVAASVAAHGSPVRLESLADVLAFDAEYRERVARTVLWVPTRRALLVNVLGVVIGLAIAVPMLLGVVAQ